MAQSAWENRGTFHLMRRVMQMHNALWRSRLPDLSPVQFAVLYAIERLPGSDQKTIADAAAVEKTTMAPLVDRLARAGLIERTIDPRDARRHRLSLNDSGRAVLDAARPAVFEVRDEVLAAVPAADREALRRILGALAEPLASNES